MSSTPEEVAAVAEPKGLPCRQERQTTFRSKSTWPSPCLSWPVWCSDLAAGLPWLDITGAIISPGTFVVEGNVKKVQHSYGGIVSEINVKNGDHVQSGQILDAA